MKRIGITGPTGAGKTTALDALKELGACVIDADAVYHDLLQSSAPLRSALTDRFGGEILDKAGKLDRKRMGNVVFQDPAALAELNGITHRFILAEIERLCAQAEAQGRPAAAIDAIALVESGAAGVVKRWWGCWRRRRCAYGASWRGKAYRRITRAGGWRPSRKRTFFGSTAAISWKTTGARPGSSFGPRRWPCSGKYWTAQVEMFIFP